MMYQPRPPEEPATPKTSSAATTVRQPKAQADFRPVTIAGNWAGSNLVAGIETSGTFGMAGDLAISVTTALSQAAEEGHTLSTEIKVLILHGLLHLAGYDHEVDNGKMARRERLLRTRLRLPLGLIERAEQSTKATAKGGRA